MEQHIFLFEEFLMKAMAMTENFLNLDFSGEVKFEEFTANRERLLQIIDQISRQVDWNQISDEKKSELNRQIEYMKKLDEKLLVKLQEQKTQLRKEIEQTVRQKDNIKGYNLSDVK